MSSDKNIIINGSFENHDQSQLTGSWWSQKNVWGILKKIHGWQTFRKDGYIEVQTSDVSGIVADDGNAKVELDANPTGNGNSGIFQDVEVNAGTNYVLKFSYSPRVEIDNTNTNDIEVYWDNQLLAVISGDQQGWQEYEFNVKGGNDATTRLMFKAAGQDDGVGGLLDNVSLIKGTSSKDSTNDKGKMKFFGNSDDDDMSGMSGDDIINGGYGDDTINAGAGDDIIYGDTNRVGTHHSDITLLKTGNGESNIEDNVRFDKIIDLNSNGLDNNGYADIQAKDFVTGDNFSFAGWVNFEQTSHWQRIFDFGNGRQADNILLAREGTSNNLAFHVYSGNQYEITMNAHNVITNGQWMHVAVTMEKPSVTSDVRVKLYVNGAEVATTTGDYNVATMVREHNFIGRSQWDEVIDGDGASDTQVTGITISDRAFTSQEISTIKTNTENVNNPNAVLVTHNIADDTDNINQHGNDTINAGAGDDIIYGNAGNDTINGGSGDDTINGGDGDDTINGGNGDDTLTGGAGDDEFIFDNSNGNIGKDTITDFDRSEDKINLSNYTKSDGTKFDATNQPIIIRDGLNFKIILDSSIGDEILVRNVGNLDVTDFIFFNEAPIANNDVFFDQSINIYD